MKFSFNLRYYESAHDEKKGMKKQNEYDRNDGTYEFATPGNKTHP